MSVRYSPSTAGTDVGPSSSSSGPYWPLADSGAAAGASSGRVAFANTSPCPGSSTPQPKPPALNSATAIALPTGSSGPIRPVGLTTRFTVPYRANCPAVALLTATVPPTTYSVGLRQRFSSPLVTLGTPVAPTSRIGAPFCAASPAAGIASAGGPSAALTTTALGVLPW